MSKDAGAAGAAADVATDAAATTDTFLFVVARVALEAFRRSALDFAEEADWRLCVAALNLFPDLGVSAAFFAWYALASRRLCVAFSLALSSIDSKSKSSSNSHPSCCSHISLLLTMFSFPFEQA